MTLRVSASLVALIATLMLALLPTSSFAADAMLRVNTSVKPPYSTQEENGALDLVLREVFNRIGREIVFVRLPPERALYVANEGKSDAEVPRIRGLERKYPNLIMVPESILDYDFVAVTCLDDIEVNGWADLGHHSVGYIIGWKIFEENVPVEAETTRVATPSQLMQMVAYRRIQVGLYERYAGHHLARHMDLSCLREAGPPLSTLPMYLYLHASHASLVPRLTQALKDMKRDGTYAKILRATLGK